MSGIVERRRIQTFHADGFGDFFLVNGVLRCTAFMLTNPGVEGLPPVKEAVFHLRAAVAGAAEAQIEVERLLQEAPPGFTIYRNVNRLGH
jgi:hypothetical protein